LHLLVVVHRAVPRQVCGAVHENDGLAVVARQQIRLGVQEAAFELLAHRRAAPQVAKQLQDACTVIRGLRAALDAVPQQRHAGRQRLRHGVGAFRTPQQNLCADGTTARSAKVEKRRQKRAYESDSLGALRAEAWKRGEERTEVRAVHQGARDEDIAANGKVGCDCAKALRAGAVALQRASQRATLQLKHTRRFLALQKRFIRRCVRFRPHVSGVPH
jgi:hypothetical protein